MNTKKPAKRYGVLLVMHTHRHGVELHPVRVPIADIDAVEKLEDYQLAKLLKLDFEPDDEEFLESVVYRSVAKMPVVSSKRIASAAKVQPSEDDCDFDD